MTDVVTPLTPSTPESETPSTEQPIFQRVDLHPKAREIISVFAETLRETTLAIIAASIIGTFVFSEIKGQAVSTELNNLALIVLSGYGGWVIRGNGKR